METKPSLHLLFVCISNLGRSAFAEFFFPKMMRERDKKLINKVKVTSAGYNPQKVRDQLTELHTVPPDPIYNRSIAETTRAALLKHGIIVPDEWRSRKLSPEMVEDADLIITALPEQKGDLINLYPEARYKIFTIREMSRWDEYLLFEDYGGLPDDHTFWGYVEENSDYVSKVLSEMEKVLIRGFPYVLEQLGVEFRE